MKKKVLVQICNFYPYEPSALRAKVERLKKKLKKGNAKPIKVLPVNGELLVVKGNNTVIAALESDMIELEATVIFKREQEMRPYRDALACAQKEGKRGFNKFPVDSSFAERRNRY